MPNIEQKKSRIDRLRRFAETVFGSARKMGEAVGKSQSYFGSYFHKEELPPLNILAQLQPHGLDLYWLFTGREYTDDTRHEGLDIEAERGYILQRRYAQSQRGGTDRGFVQRSTLGEKMESLAVSEIWDQISIQFPGTPLWEQLSKNQRRKFLYQISKGVMDLQESLEIEEGDEES